MLRALLLVSLCALLSSCAAPPPVEPEEVARYAIPPDRAYRAKGLIEDVGVMRPLEGGWVVSGVAINLVEVRFALMAQENVPDGPAVGTVVLSPPHQGAVGGRRSKSFAIAIETESEDPLVGRHLESVAKSVERRDAGGFYAMEMAWRTDGTPKDLLSASGVAKGFFEEHGQPLGAFLALLIAWLALAARLRRAGHRVELTESVRPTHLLPAGIQLALFVYWGLYYVEVGELLGDLVIQVAFAYGLEGLFLAWKNAGKVTVSASVLPIVGSMNLFVWFLGEDRWIALLTIALAIASKHLIEREGRHIFNPSAFGITITGLACMVFPETFGFFDLSHAFNAGPNMLELILLVGLLAQLRIPIVLVTLGAFLALASLVDTQLLSRPSALWGPVCLASSLLITDPATIPKTPVGKLLFGAVYGALMALMATGLTAMGENDFFTKVFPLPLVNLLVPSFDRWGARWGARTGGWLSPAFNRAHVLVWVLLVVGMLYGTNAKTGGFEHNRYDAALAPKLVVGDDGHATCARNVAHCEPFSVMAEVALWDQDAPPEIEPRTAHGLPLNRSAIGILLILLAAVAALLWDLPKALADLRLRGPGGRATLAWLVGLTTTGAAIRFGLEATFIREAFPLLPIPPFLDARLLGEAIDVYPQGPHLMAAALAPLLSPDPVEAWFTSNALYGALTIPAAYALGAAATGRARVGLFAAALLALWPQHIRVSASESAHVALMLWATLACAWSLMAARSGRLSAFAAAVSAACALVMTRPEASVWGLAIVSALLFAAPGVRSRVVLPSRLLIVATALWMLVPFLLDTLGAPQTARLAPGAETGESVSGSSVLSLLGLLVTPDNDNAFFDAATTPLWLWPLALLGVVMGVKYVGRATLLGITGVVLAYLLLYAEMREAGVVWTKARYHAAALPAVALLTALGLEDALSRVASMRARGRRVVAVLALCCAGTAIWWPGGSGLPMDWQQELSWLHTLGTREPALMSRGARVVIPDNRRRFLDQSPRSRIQLLSGGAQHADQAIPVAHALEHLEPQRLSAPVFYYRGLYCHLAVAPDGSEPLNPQCAAMERAFEMEPIETLTVDAPVYQQAYVGVRRDGPVELGLYRVRRRLLERSDAMKGLPKAIEEARTDVFPMGTHAPPETMPPRPPLASP